MGFINLTWVDFGLMLQPQNHAGLNYEFVDVVKYRISSRLSSYIGGNQRLEFDLAGCFGRWVDCVGYNLDSISTSPGYL